MRSITRFSLISIFVIFLSLAALAWLAACSATPPYERGIAYLQKSEYRRAIEQFDKAIEASPEDGKIYARRGNAYFELGEYQAAIDDFSQAIERGCVDLEAYYLRGRSYYNLGRYTEAVADFTSALELDCREFDSFLNRAYAYYELDQYEEAAADLSNALELDPHNSELYRFRGYILLEDLGEHERGLANFRRCLEYNPDDAICHNNLAWALVYYLDADYEEALEHALISVEQDPDEHNHDTLAWVYYKLGRYEEALEHFDIALSYDPEQHISYKGRGDVYMALGDAGAALKDYQAYMRLAPDGLEKDEVMALIEALGE